MVLRYLPLVQITHLIKRPSQLPCRLCFGMKMILSEPSVLTFPQGHISDTLNIFFSSGSTQSYNYFNSNDLARQLSAICFIHLIASPFHLSLKERSSVKAKVKKETRQTHRERINGNTSSLVYVFLLNQVTGHFVICSLLTIFEDRISWVLYHGVYGQIWCGFGIEYIIG